MDTQIAKEEPVIVQRYLPDPYLINGYKENDQFTSFVIQDLYQSLMS